jgi:hypothetical protein
MIAASPVPSVFKEGWLRPHKKIPFLSGADGVVINFKQKYGALAGIKGGYATSH